MFKAVFYLTTALSLISWVPKHWLIEGTTAFVPLYGLIFLFYFVFFIIKKRTFLVLGVFILLFINFIHLFSFFDTVISSGTDFKQIKLIQLNVSAPQKKFNDVTAYLLKSQADIVVLEECSERCFQQLEKDGVTELYEDVYKSTIRHRICVLSQYNMKQIPIAIDGDPAIVDMNMSIEGREVDLIGWHAIRPMFSESAFNQHTKQSKQIASLVKILAAKKGSVIVAGDFNTTVWGRGFSELMKNKYLQLSSPRFLPTFPRYIPKIHLPFVPMFTIDHVLTTQNIMTPSAGTGINVGSDHLPVEVQLDIPLYNLD